jgi:hypothetical protein
MIQQQADEISRQTKVIQDQDRSMSAFYNNKYLWAVLGAVTAAYLVKKWSHSQTTRRKNKMKLKTELKANTSDQRIKITAEIEADRYTLTRREMQRWKAKIQDKLHMFLKEDGYHVADIRIIKWPTQWEMNWQ